MTGLSWLETFDLTATDATAEPNIAERTYEQGVADANAAFSESQTHLTEQIVQAISDLQFNYQEARSEVANGFLPLIQAIVEQLMPAIVDESLKLQILSLLEDQAPTSAQQKFGLTVHPRQVTALGTAIKDQLPDIEIWADPKLAEHAAWVRIDGGEQHIDLTTTTNEIARLLSGRHQPRQRTASNE